MEEGEKCREERDRADDCKVRETEHAQAGWHGFELDVTELEHDLLLNLRFETLLHCLSRLGDLPLLSAAVDGGSQMRGRRIGAIFKGWAFRSEFDLLVVLNASGLTDVRSFHLLEIGFSGRGGDGYEAALADRVDGSVAVDTMRELHEEILKQCVEV